ncbi:GNAT family N-acetyltransferase [Stappia sp. GBMRC 2046]|uniref:GNAT family N-acetyltransferase n=1 Tax=Stappia sediminis TaxID=2692190 RepID=A0A7X3LU88_9HYPH|nr:GNAT family N-acetyltransferase [Stappia sediminis]MXN65226.1 GNAT family N-acetyltransferase [Stappia sediminis]
MTDLTGLRLAMPEDAQAISNLAKAAYERYVPVMNAIPLPMSADYSAHIADDTVLVLDGGDGLDASLVLMERSDHLYIWSIAVCPKAQGKGLGGKLMSHCEALARGKGLSEIRLFTNVFMRENQAWYRRQGFVETGEEQIGDKRIVHFVKRLG